jgi:hypothetical protein
MEQKKSYGAYFLKNVYHIFKRFGDSCTSKVHYRKHKTAKGKFISKT